MESTIKVDVKASVNIAGKFDKRDASLTFASPDETTGVLEITIQAASVDAGSCTKNGKLKGKDNFDVEQNPVITFKSTKIVKTGHETYEVDGDFAIRGVSNPEKLTLTVSGRGTGSGEIKGKMVFNRKADGMNKGIPFIKIAEHVDVNFRSKGNESAGLSGLKVMTTLAAGGLRRRVPLMLVRVTAHLPNSFRSGSQNENSD
ncbi:MAG TPA: YceI family protein [Candidatus Acidoferrum sp.]